MWYMRKHFRIFLSLLVFLFTVIFVYAGINITLISPEQESGNFFFDDVQNFTFDVSGVFDSYECSLYIDDSLVNTLSGLPDTQANFSVNLSSYSKELEWFVRCSSFFGQSHINETYSIGNSTDPLILGGNITAGRSLLGPAQLPLLLSNGVFRVQYAHKNYSYIQSLYPGENVSVGFSDGPISTSPYLVLNESDKQLWKYEFQLNDSANLSSVNVSDEFLEILGKSFVVDANISEGDNLTLYDYEKSTLFWLNQSQNFTIKGIDYEIVIPAAFDVNQTAVVSVNGSSRTVGSGDFYPISGLQIYFKDVTVTSNNVSANLLLGAREIEISTDGMEDVFIDGQPIPGVKAQADSVQNFQNLTVEFTPFDLDGTLHKFNKTEYIVLNGAVTDPLFGTFGFFNLGPSIPLESSSKSRVELRTQGNNLEVSFANYDGHKISFDTHRVVGGSVGYRFDAIGLGYAGPVENSQTIRYRQIFILNENSSEKKTEVYEVYNFRSGTGEDFVSLRNLSTGQIFEYQDGKEIGSSGIIIQNISNQGKNFTIHGNESILNLSNRLYLEDGISYLLINQDNFTLFEGNSSILEIPLFVDEGVKINTIIPEENVSFVHDSDRNEDLFLTLKGTFAKYRIDVNRFDAWVMPVNSTVTYNAKILTSYSINSPIFTLHEMRHPFYTNIKTHLPYLYNESNEYWFNITLEDHIGVDSAKLYLTNGTSENFSAYNLTNESNLWTYNVSNLSVGNYSYYFWANDTAGNEGNVTKISRFKVVENLSNSEMIIDTTDITVSNKTDLIVETLPEQVEIPSNVTSRVKLIFNSRPDNSVYFENSLVAVRNASNKLLHFEIAPDTTMSVSGDWDGSFILPETTSVSISGIDISLAVNVGIDAEINFSSPIKIILPGESGKRVGWRRGSGSLTEITTTCNSASAPTNINTNNPRSCKINSDGDLVVWTYHLTTFVAYQTVTSGDSSNGGTQQDSPSAPPATTFTITDSQLNAGYERWVSTGHLLIFTVNSTQYNARIDSIRQNGITMTINPSSQTRSIGIGGEWKVNLNNDSRYDLAVTLLNVSDNRAQVKLQRISEETAMIQIQEETTPEDEEEIVATTEPEAEEEKKKRGVLIAIISIIVLIALGVGAFFLVRKLRN